MGIRGRDDQLVVVDRHVALGERIAGFGDELRRQIAPVLPDEIAVGGIERLHLVGVVEDEEHAVMHDRRRLGRPIGQGPGPDQLEILDVALVDLLEWAIAPRVVGPPPHQPVTSGRVAQHGVGDRRNVAGRWPSLLGQARGRRQGEKRQSQRGCLQKTLKHMRSPPLLWLLTGTRPIDRKIMEEIASMLAGGACTSTVSGRLSDHTFADLERHQPGSRSTFAISQSRNATSAASSCRNGR